MKLSITELKVISELGGGNKEIPNIAQALKLSESQIYRAIQSLRRKGILNDYIQPYEKTHINMLFRIMTKAPNISGPLSGAGMKIFAEFIEPNSVSQVEKNTGLHKTTILKKIKQGRKYSLFLKKKNIYYINNLLWTNVKEFFIELKKYEESIDSRVPVTSTIYFKNDSEILFSNKDELDATLTGFCAYEDFGIKILNITYYYYLPKKKLKKEEVFMHSLLITEKEMSIQNIIIIALFYVKYKKDLNKIQHHIVDNLKKVLKGEKVIRYPSLDEIKDRAEIYNIEV